jgi:hypothetical protein
MADETVKQEQKHITLMVKNRLGEEVQFKVCSSAMTHTAQLKSGIPRAAAVLGPKI